MPAPRDLDLDLQAALALRNANRQTDGVSAAVRVLPNVKKEALPGALSALDGDLRELEITLQELSDALDKGGRP